MAKANTVTTTELDFDIAALRLVKRRLNQGLRSLEQYEKHLMKKKKLLKLERRDESARRRTKTKGVHVPEPIVPLS